MEKKVTFVHFGGDHFKLLQMNDIPSAITRTPKDSMVIIWKEQSYEGPELNMPSRYASYMEMPADTASSKTSNGLLPMTDAPTL